ncbi:MAG: AAA family ATPase [Candidatus Omnitrophota bacterium]|nr:AAA family ATPase [Candidatus Omnitrophota bacterium]
MSYYKILGLHREPFSTSPDPDFFYLSKEHDLALTNLLIELHLRRGLSVILGDVGTGKTTLSRKLVQCLRHRGEFILHVILDPYFETEQHLLNSLVRNFEIPWDQYYGTQNSGAPAQVTAPQIGLMDLKEIFQKFLYDQCIIKNKTVVLIVDEAQKLSQESMEMLRVMLNYETNENKLLQLVLLGQLELHSKIMRISNFFDRVSFKYALNPLSLDETRHMIHFRMKQAGYEDDGDFFFEDAVRLIHESARGYPRKIMMLCHRALKAVIMKDATGVDERMVRNIIEEDVRSGWLTLQKSGF